MFAGLYLSVFESLPQVYGIELKEWGFCAKSSIGGCCSFQLVVSTTATPPLADSPRLETRRDTLSV